MGPFENMFRFLATLFLVGMSASILPTSNLTAQDGKVAQRPPNLIIVLTDDQGYADVGFNGCTDIPTPHIDRIANEGVRFTNGYVSYSVCGPSRAGLMTGRYQDRFGSSLNPTIDPSNPAAGIPVSETNLAEALKTVGYTNMAVGKWHLGTHPTLQPLARGFDEFFGFLSGGHRYFPEELTLQDLSEVKKQWDWYRTKLLRNEKRVEITEYLTDELSNATVDFIDRQKDKPFFLYLAYNAPHGPLQATEKYLDRFQRIENQKRRTYAAMVSAVDDGVGKILAKLEEHNLSQDTLIVFLSDNGGPTKKNGSSNAPLRGDKGSPFEDGIRVPFAMRWTGTLPSGVDYERPVISLDILATIAPQAGVTIAEDRPLDGVDLLPFLTGAQQGPPHDKLYWRFFKSNTFVIRSGDDKLIHNASANAKQLYDLANDISESKNLSDQRGSVTDQLTSEAQQWSQELVPPAYPGLGTWLKKKGSQ
jgi:arylsulfatase A-like enzyme